MRRGVSQGNPKQNSIGGKIGMGHRKKGMRIGESKVTVRKVNGKRKKVRVTKLSGKRYRVRVVNPVRKRGVTRRGGYADKYGPGLNPNRDRATRSQSEEWEQRDSSVLPGPF